MHFVDEGSREGGPTLLFLHGNPTWSFHFRHLISHFRGDYRCVAPDHVGCGLSDKPQGYEYRLERHIANVQALVEELDLRDVVLCLHDWGGAIGCGLAARIRERVKGLVLFNTSAFVLPRMPLSIGLCRIPGFGALAVRGFNAFVRGALRYCSMKPLSAAARAGYLAPYHDWASRIATLRFVQDIPMSAGHPSRALLDEIEAGLPALGELPGLICWGGKDFVFDDTFLEGWKQRLPKAEVRYFENAGHFVVEDAREEICLATGDFLKEAAQ